MCEYKFQMMRQNDVVFEFAVDEDEYGISVSQNQPHTIYGMRLYLYIHHHAVTFGTSLCTVLLEMAKPFAAWRTVASFSMMYCASRTARSSGKPFTWFPSPVRFFRHPYSMREQRLSILPSGNFSVYYSTNNSCPYV